MARMKIPGIPQRLLEVEGHGYGAARGDGRIFGNDDGLFEVVLCMFSIFISPQR